MAVKATNEQIVTYVNSTADSPFYQTYPQGDINNIQAVYDDLMKYQPKRNAFVQSLYQMIGWQSVANTIFNNPYNFLKKAPMRYGAYERETFVNMLDVYDYNFYDMEKELMQIYKSNVMSAYHELRFKKKVPVTISYDELREAFAEPYGLQSLINSKLAVIPATVEYWEYQTINQLLDKAYTNGAVYPVTVQTPNNEETARNILKLVRSYGMKAGFPNPAFNFAGAQSPSSMDDLVLITTPEVMASLDVDALAVLFNEERANIRNRIIVIDSFINTSVVAMLVDMRWFKWREQLNEMGGFYNPDALRTNFFYHYWALISASPFYTCIAFTTDTVSVTGVTVSEGQTFTPGMDTTINTTVSGADGAVVPKGVTYQITSEITSPETVIVPGTNVLHVGDSETAASISVKVTSSYDNTKSVSVEIEKA